MATPLGDSEAGMALPPEAQPAALPPMTLRLVLTWLRPRAARLRRRRLFRPAPSAWRSSACASRMRCGKVDINGGVFNINAPAGGYKQSGIGRERGPHAIDEYQEIKSMQFISEDAARNYFDLLQN
jgi:hypothetical protein